MQAAHLGAGDLQHLLQTFATFQHSAMLEHGRRHGHRRIEVVVLKATQPRTGDRWIGAGAVQVRFALGDGENLAGMATQMVVVHFLLFSPGRDGPKHEVTPSILQRLRHCNAGKTARSRAVPQAVQTVTRAVPKPSRRHSIRPRQTGQALDLPDLHGSGPSLALRL